MNGIVVDVAMDGVAKAAFIVAVAAFGNVCDRATLNVVRQKKWLKEGTIGISQLIMNGIVVAATDVVTRAVFKAVVAFVTVGHGDSINIIQQKGLFKQGTFQI